MSRTHNGIYDKVCDFENLFRAYLKARKCKRYRPEVLRFTSRLEDELIGLQRALVVCDYKTGRYNNFVIYEPKKRLIAALPFRDRVVHHALCNIIEPLFEKKFIYDSYGCRVGKGTHAGSARLVEFQRRAQRVWDRVYCLKADISRFFPSVDHEALKDIMRRTIRCQKTLWLIDEIVGSVPGKNGMPIGNLTSQLFANVYLNGLDHFVKETLRAKFYLRYMDDFVILHGDKRMLGRWKEDIAVFLREQLRLEYNKKTMVFPVSQGVDFLGYRTWPTHKLLRKRSIIKARRKLKRLSVQYSGGEIAIEAIRPVIASWLGHAKHANSYNVVKRVLSGVVFSKS